MDDIRHTLPATPTRFIDCLHPHIRESGLAYRIEQASSIGLNDLYILTISVSLKISAPLRLKHF